MVLNDTLANALSLVMNSEKVVKQECTIKPISKLILQVFELLNKEGYVGTYTLFEDIKGNFIKINLLGNINKCGVIKPRFAVQIDNYEKFEKRFLPSRNIGFLIVSTSQGLMTHRESKKKGLGGKLIAYCY
jgi:small subunit ribosomal protein S8